MKKLHRSVDVVITDPPYGFNTPTSEGTEMINLYARLAPTLVDCLRPWGQFLIALPAFAKNGRQIPFYQTRDLFVKQVIYHVEAEGRDVIRFAESVPGVPEFFKLPWYWGTSNTIERRVLHFVIR